MLRADYRICSVIIGVAFSLVNHFMMCIVQVFAEWAESYFGGFLIVRRSLIMAATLAVDSHNH
jgi:hypothetical protein